MKLRFLPLAGFLLSSCLALSSVARKTQSGTESVHKWVQGFYDWYVPAAIKDNSDPGSYIALKKRGSDFSAALVNGLKEDLAASIKSKDEVVGLDFDPFLDSQDPCDHYKVEKISEKGGMYSVEAYGIREGKEETTASVIAEVAKVNGKFQFKNFVYPEAKSDLLSVLKQLKADRDKYGH
ncbi:MAG TPA: hypothetical protein VGL56_05815 [Fimbriimonadaceae bacterium]|jgi:hypothetical protein